MNKQLQNNKPLLALLFALLIGTGTAWAQAEFTVCDGTTTDQRIPMTGYCANQFGKHEFVYPQDLLTQIQGTGISSLRFYSTSTTKSWGNAIFRVFMKTINTSTLSDYQGYEDATIVYEGSLSVVGGMMDIQFTTPYYYSTGNLLIGVYQIEKGNSSTCLFYGQTVNGASIAGWNENSIENLNASNAQFPNFLPKTTFSYDGEITATVSPDGSGTVSGTGIFTGGSTCTLEAVANDGYTFINWVENGVVVSTNASYTFMVNGDRNLVANFAQDGNITFDDDNVRTLCVSNWDTNDDGDLSYAEAAAVTSIGTVFKGNTDITLFDELQYFTSLASIEDKAFRGCTALERITIPENVASIGEQAFNGCTALAEITIPENVASIGNRAFWGCPALTTVHFNAINCTTMSTNYEDVDYSVFMSSGDPATFPLTNLTIGSNVQNIPDYAFKGCSALSSDLNLPNSVATIGQYAFHSCTNLATLTIGEGVETIGKYAFWNCPNLQEVHFNAVNCTSMKTITGSNPYSSDLSYCCSYSVFNSGTSEDDATPIVTLTIGENVTRIPEYAFRNSTNAEGGLTLPNSVTTIGEYAFYGCTGFTSGLTLGNSVTTIGRRAFCDCTGFTGGLVIPNSVTTIGKEAFSGCTGFTGNLTIGNSVTTIEESAFSSCTGFTGSLVIPSSLTTIGKAAFVACRGFTGSLVIPNSVTTIGESAFNSCRGFTGNLVIPNSVTTIEGGAFYNCSGFTGSLVIPNSVTSIGRFAFASCTGFTGNLVIPNSVTTIEGGVFSGCGFTGNLVIPNSVTTISDAAFYGCSGFTGLVIPNSVTSIGLEAFYRCTGFTGSLVIPNSVTSIGLEAFYRCTGFTGNLVISSSVTTIDEYAFYYCTGFTGSLVIPNSVTTIKKCAFYGCTGFNGLLVIGRGVNTIEQSAFYNCSGFTGVVSETATPPTAQSYSFGDMTSSIPVYVVVPSDYSNATGWSVFTNYNAQNVFNNLGSDNKWSSMLNWSSLSAPTSTQVVRIKENCALDTDADVRFVYIADDEKVLTVNEGKALNTTYGVHIEDAEQLVVGDGGQVKSNIPFCGTVQKHINAYTSNDDGWSFIASPVAESLVSANVTGLIPSGETVYDLYYLDEENTYWRNYKVNAFEINHNQGYLYGNQAGTTISFSGALQPYVAEGVSIPLTKEGEGWNLVGNPFTFNAYADKPYYVINGRNVEAAASGAIAPCTGIVVKAEGTANETVKFTKDEPVTSSAPSNGSLQIVLDEANTRGASTGSATAIDNAIVSFNEGTTLPKFRFGDNAQIYIPQNGEDYAIACAAKTGELPLNFKATKNGEYTLTVNPEGVEMNYLHLIDNMTGADVDLLQTSDYTFNAKTTDYTSRFRLVFSANSVDENGASTGSAAFAYINNGNIVITDIADTCDVSLQVIDVTGRVVVSVGGHTRCVPTARMTPGVYVLRLINGNDVKTQKMVIR